MGGSVESILFPPESRPYGISYNEWTVRWWRWFLSIDKDFNPATDSSGVDSEQKQDDPNVWFLAGTLGGFAERTCRVPYGKAIIMPVINYECSFADEPSITTDWELEDKSKREIDDIKDVRVKIDEITLEDLSPFRIRSPLFMINLQEDNILGATSGFTKMISDGYWIIVKPLGFGEHQVNSFGSCRSGKIKIATSYKLTVV